MVVRVGWSGGVRGEGKEKIGSKNKKIEWEANFGPLYFVRKFSVMHVGSMDGKQRR